MKAEDIMVREVETVQLHENVGDILHRMRTLKYRTLPVIDEHGRVLGEFSTYKILTTIVPSYITSGDLDHVEFVPDIGVLKRRYNEIASKIVADIMNPSPILVDEKSSVLSVAAELLASHHSSLAMVVSKDKHLKGVVARSDILCFVQESGVENRA
ncbi:MAG: CBS domain-containing protein [Zetaproteobacteria bacterium CG_4_9_14_3_um_filter_49_83]|nr:MAG: hypothetical protein AUJ56_06620 [Zetaproteobacteria bacterium CG1_02_49_23]PIQ33485.1 MAG: CBS domain-containing protein [Zetaproteobacteria bacterium CG17_big_fil_post_rev_8_21_14_2_50_50_13]PIV29334.1 MAG: CBS domain-containing protein [Zetaproteobacteria bacterium CG02_land_8_20_14_3_00_50_9]PIY55693.1 MAG: CBS domain-containing protein [Zetaproteobacteria bacterium CG_4_10_14_0_8_um_filter_49_80]PJA36044.1 MAG: CBS domain-containing protein [Zetaproteobacteria bacterium CG_4_9_14_3